MSLGSACRRGSYGWHMHRWAFLGIFSEIPRPYPDAFLRLRHVLIQQPPTQWESLRLMVRASCRSHHLRLSAVSQGMIKQKKDLKTSVSPHGDFYLVQKPSAQHPGAFGSPLNLNAVPSPVIADGCFSSLTDFHGRALLVLGRLRA